jgi:pSer/pThr/pTyr-binding forkhead associated (FHA) protein
MPTVTFQVLEGIDKGRSFRELPTPVSIGREEGNLLRLNDERVSRFHAKIQFDNGEMILTDLESTNGTRVNGNVVQIRRLRPGDRIGLGRSLLLYGSETEIAARLTTMGSTGTPPAVENPEDEGAATLHASSLASEFEHDANFDLNAHDKITTARGALFHGTRPLPPLPEKMSPSQAARLAELLDFLHHHMTTATENIQADEEGNQVNLAYADWQRIMTIQMLLARYVRAVAEPDILDE